MSYLHNLLRVVFVTGTILALLNIQTNANPLEALLPKLRVKEFSLSRKGLALGGYDPVSYFQNNPLPGSKDLSFTFRGVTYHFSSKENQDHFKKNPFQYEPQYGGWCAWAMADNGGRTEANPKRFKIINDKLYVFYDGFFGNTLDFWNEVTDDNGLVKKADNYWVEQVLR